MRRRSFYLILIGITAFFLLINLAPNLLSLWVRSRVEIEVLGIQEQNGNAVSPSGESVRALVDEASSLLLKALSVEQQGRGVGDVFFLEMRIAQDALVDLSLSKGYFDLYHNDQLLARSGYLETLDLAQGTTRIVRIPVALQIARKDFVLYVARRDTFTIRGEAEIKTSMLSGTLRLDFDYRHPIN